MKKIGFIDYYIDEWHADNYPTWIRESSYRKDFDVALAWEEITPEGRKPLFQWCKEQKVSVAGSLEQVVEESDCIVVLSPDNPECHERLADLPLKSGKPVYIDKPFAPSLDAGLRLFEKAEQHGTPLMSSSALRFGSALRSALDAKADGEMVNFVSTRGSGVYAVYSIHQVEMLAMAMGPRPKGYAVRKWRIKRDGGRLC